MWDDRVFGEINQETDNVRKGFSNIQLIPNHPNIKKNGSLILRFRLSIKLKQLYGQKTGEIQKSV